MKNWFNEEWLLIENDVIDFEKHEPISISSSLHIYEERYCIDGNTYRLLYPIGDSSPPSIEILK